MLKSLRISNYALIDELSIDFHEGFNIITGETGAGKSIILGALGLILGQRADMAVLQDKERKCIVEGHFSIEGQEDFFKENELDYEELSILRREITPQGKSRAFINDTPVNLNVLQKLAVYLIDIHSQHQNLELGNRSFQLNLVDLVAGNDSKLSDYQQIYQSWNNCREQLNTLKEKAENANAELDYIRFQFNQLEEAHLSESEQEELENEQQTLEHAEDIKLTFGRLSEVIYQDGIGIFPVLKEQIALLTRLSGVVNTAGQFKERLDSCLLELKDIADESATLSERTEHSPERLQLILERLDTIYALQQKFRVRTISELLEIKSQLKEKVVQAESFDSEISKLTEQLEELYNQVIGLGGEISGRRKGVAKKISESVVDVLHKLAMASVSLLVRFESLPMPGINGMDSVRFLFSANSQSEPQEISKIASGGEISRVMLALKTLITNNKLLPSIVFDEIDSGISGEVALKMGLILKEMSQKMQVINITHLPQIAAKGQHHFKVYKFTKDGRTYTSIRELSQNERVEELASMLGGDNITEATRSAACELLNI